MILLYKTKMQTATIKARITTTSKLSLSASFGACVLNFFHTQEFKWLKNTDHIFKGYALNYCNF